MAYHRDTPGSGDFSSDLVRVERDSSGAWNETEVMIENVKLGAKWSTVNNMIAYTSDSEGQKVIFVWDAKSRQSRVLTETRAPNVVCPMWSRDGKTIYYNASDSLGNTSIRAVSKNGGPVRQVVDLTGFELGIGVPSLDSERVYYTISEIASDIWVMELEN